MLIDDGWLKIKLIKWDPSIQYYQISTGYHIKLLVVITIHELPVRDEVAGLERSDGWWMMEKNDSWNGELRPEMWLV